jgi:predicted nucleic-acid-binding Zn-ribbon protein
MNEFHIANPCIKCGYSGNAADIQYKVGYFDLDGQENIYSTEFSRPSPAYLLRTCARCGYKWPEKTIDNGEDK